MGLLDRIAASRDSEQRSTIDQWLTEYLIPANQFQYGGTGYTLGLQQTIAGTKTQQYTADLPGHMAALRNCPPAFAAQLVRSLVISQARFTFRNNRVSGTPGRTFGTRALEPLEHPWTNGTTGQMLARMEWHAGLAGNAYVTSWQRGRLRVLRPDWTAILYGSQLEPDDPSHALDGEVIGYVYQNGGFYAGNQLKPRTLVPSEVVHWAPQPDPENAGLGMSWITPAIRDIQGDQLASQHKIKYFENGATPNLVVKGIPALNKDQFDEIVAAMEDKHAGVANAYRTLYLTAGADATVVGSNFQQMDFRSTQGMSETRIAFLSRVPATLLGISEGLSGSSLNTGNFSQSRRIFADTWVYPTLQDLATALAPLIQVPFDAELWFDTTDMPLLREDAKDAAAIQQLQASTITSLVREGFTADSAIAATLGQNMQLLQHTGLLSVQLQPPGTVMPPASGGPTQMPMTGGSP